MPLTDGNLDREILQNCSTGGGSVCVDTEPYLDLYNDVGVDKMDGVNYNKFRQYP